jgi:hypothetical protein
MLRLPYLMLLVVSLLGGGCYEPVSVEEAACAPPDHDCPHGYLCVQGVCYRSSGGVAVACIEDLDCPAGVCLREAHICVGCMNHGQCVSGLCNIPTHICVGCKADYQCQSGVCDVETGICENSDEEFATKEPSVDN